MSARVEISAEAWSQLLAQVRAGVPIDRAIPELKISKPRLYDRLAADPALAAELREAKVAYREQRDLARRQAHAVVVAERRAAREAEAAAALERKRAAWLVERAEEQARREREREQVRAEAEAKREREKPAAPAAEAGVRAARATSTTKFTPELAARAVLGLAAGMQARDVARSLGLNPALVASWIGRGRREPAGPFGSVALAFDGAEKAKAERRAAAHAERERARKAAAKPAPLSLVAAPPSPKPWAPRDLRPTYEPDVLRGAVAAAAAVFQALERGRKFPEVPSDVWGKVYQLVHVSADPAVRDALALRILDSVEHRARDDREATLSGHTAVSSGGPSKKREG
jgi:hypothetical protein